MQANSYVPLITKPTRVTESSATLIDHIWTNNIQSDEQSQIKTGIIVHDLSDHMPIFLIRNSSVYPQGYTNIKFRIFSEENIDNFKEEIASSSSYLYNIISTDNTLDIKVSEYFSEYKKIYNKHFPVKSKKIHNKTLSKPWITSDLQKLIKKKNFLYYKKLKQPTMIATDKYKQCKKDLDKILKLSKKLYFERKMFETSKNMKARWDAIRLLINKNKNKTSNCPIKHSTLGKHYSTIAENLNSQLPNVECNVLKSSNETSTLHFSFCSVDEGTIYDTINKLDSKKGPGSDEIPAKILKTTAKIVAPHLCLIFNECLRQGGISRYF